MNVFGGTRQRFNVNSVGVSFFFFQAEDGIRDADVTGVQTCALPISHERSDRRISLVWSAICGFQSTLLQEERQGSVFIGKRGRAFNPRSYKRSDYLKAR